MVWSCMVAGVQDGFCRGLGFVHMPRLTPWKYIIIIIILQMIEDVDVNGKMYTYKGSYPYAVKI